MCVNYTATCCSNFSHLLNDLGDIRRQRPAHNAVWAFVRLVKVENSEEAVRSLFGVREVTSSRGL